jgi:anthranilate synthase/aminodeoxychorismate synthase-like glutamine amidotransferase
MDIAFIDHYDSFSFNVLDWLKRAGEGRISIKRIVAGDEASLARVKYSPIPIVISPGPGRPSDYPRTLELLKNLIDKVPILGICLGHQMLGELAGGKIIKASNPWHGTTSSIRVTAHNWFTENLPGQFNAIAYNSLVIDPQQICSKEWLTLGSNQIGELMMMSHATKPIASVQFHPESFGSECGLTLAKNFIKRLSS